MLIDQKNELMNNYHNDHKKWLSKIEFYLNEIAIFKMELQVVLYKNPKSYSILEHVEEYINILSKKRKELVLMLDQIKFHEREFVDGLEVDEVHSWEHMKIKQKCESFEETFKMLKVMFKKFVARQIQGTSCVEARNHLKK